MTLNQIPRFEATNSVSVNLFTFDANVVIPAYVTSERNKPFHVNLLHYNHHYFLVRSMSDSYPVSISASIKRSFFVIFDCVHFLLRRGCKYI